MSSYDEALLVASGMALDLPSDSDESDSSVDDGTEFLYPAHMTEAATYAVATIAAEKQGLPGGGRVFFFDWILLFVVSRLVPNALLPCHLTLSFLLILLAIRSEHVQHAVGVGRE